MHSKWLVEIATLLAFQAKLGDCSRPSLPSETTYRYWQVSRARFEVWQLRLAEHRERHQCSGASQRLELWQNIRPVLEEIFLSDLLARVVAAYGSTPECPTSAELASIANNVLLTQADLRNRGLRLLMTPGLPVEQSVELNRFRHTLESWTDTFLAQFISPDQVAAFAFDQQRTRELLEENLERTCDQSRFVAWQLMSASCQAWLRRECRSLSVNAELNYQLGEIVLAMIHPDRFDDLPTEPRPFGYRISTLIDQTNRWVGQLLELEPTVNA
jgi:hypothetical protein